MDRDGRRERRQLGPVCSAFHRVRQVADPAKPELNGNGQSPGSFTECAVLGSAAPAAAAAAAAAAFASYFNSSERYWNIIGWLGDTLSAVVCHCFLYVCMYVCMYVSD